MIYDGDGNLLSQTTGQSTTLAYSNVETTSYGYDADNRQVVVIQAYGAASQTTTTKLMTRMATCCRRPPGNRRPRPTST